MSIRIQVTDRNGRAKSGAIVFVKWTSGTSKRTTNSSGIADTEVNSSSTIEYITVNDKKVLGKLSVGGDDLVEVQTSD